MNVSTWALAAVLIFNASCSGGSGSSPESELDQNTTPANISPATDTAAPTETEMPATPVTAATYTPFAYNDASFTTTLYVEAGAASGGDGSAGQPFATISSALSAAQPGVKILVATGRYPAMGRHGNLQGTQDNPILLQALGSVVVDAQGSGSGGRFVGPQYVIVDGLTIQNTERHGLNIYDGSASSAPADHLILKNMHFRDIGNGSNSDCLKLSGVQDSLVINSKFEGCNRGEGIDMVGNHNVVVQLNHFHDTAATGLQIKGGSSGILARSNTFTDIPGRSINAGGNTDNHLFRPVGAAAEASNIQLEANVFLRSGNTPVAFTGCQDCRFVNNTIIDPHGYLGRVLYENTTKVESSDNLYANNLILFNKSQLNSNTYVNVASNTTPSTFFMRNNLFFALDDEALASIPITTRVPAPQNSLIQRPHGLQDWLGGNYHLSPGSSAIGAGSVDANVPTHDFDGLPFGTPTSIGAFSAP